LARWEDPVFNPGASTGDSRFGVNFKETYSGSNEYYVSTFVRDNQQSFQDDTYIYLFRADEYHFFMIEALNNLGRYTEADVLMNMGLSRYATSVGVKSVEAWETYQKENKMFEEFSSLWIGGLDGSHKYSNDGIRNVLGLKDRPFVIDDEETPNAKKFNDCAIADEYMLEFATEGKTYPALIRIATRWNDYSIVADRVSPKYGARASEIHAKIMAGGYWVPWDLQVEVKE
jgi:hypothetical protein